MATVRMNPYSNKFKITATKLVGYPVTLSRILTAEKRKERRGNEKDMFDWSL
jgi:hypothetical protein